MCVWKSQVTQTAQARRSATTNSARGRAEVVAAALNASLPSQNNLTIAPAGTMEKLRDEVTEADRAANRSVDF